MLLAESGMVINPKTWQPKQLTSNNYTNPESDNGYQ
jgi:hypothetical protein